VNGYSEKAIETQDAYILVVEDNLQNMLLFNCLFNHIGVAGFQWKVSGRQLFEVIEEIPRVDLICTNSVNPSKSRPGRSLDRARLGGSVGDRPQHRVY